MMIAALVVVLALIAVPFGCSLMRPAGPKDRADLLRLIAEARDSLDGPGRTAVVAGKALATPDAALDFVRNQIVLADYSYRRLDPDAALAFRSANPVDKAALLAALLDAQGLQTEIRYTDWPKDVAPIQPTGIAVPEQMKTLIAAIGASPAPDARKTALANGKTMRDAVDKASAKLETIARYSASIYPHRAKSLRYWVMARKPGEKDWQAYDPLFADQPTDSGYFVTLNPVMPVKLELFSEDRRGVRTSLLAWQGPITGDMSLSYLPAVGAQQYLTGSAAPETVPLWTPILAVNGKAIAGKAFAPDGAVPPLEKDGGPLFTKTDAVPIPKIDNMRIDSIDASDYPLVKASVSADVAGPVTWRSHFLDVTDNGKRVPVRIERQPASVYGGRTVVFIIDNSGSMADKLDRVPPIIFGLIDRLGPGVRVGMTVTEQSRSLIVPPQLLSDKQTLKDAITASLKPGGQNYEVEAVETVLRDIQTPVDIVLVGDGELGAAKNGEMIRKMVDARGSRVYSILIAGKPDLYRTFSRTVWTALPGQLPDVLTAQLAGSFSDQMVIAWKADGPAAPGRKVTLGSPGWKSGPAQSQYDVVPAKTATADSPLGPGLILSVNTGVAGDEDHLRRIVPFDVPNAAAGLQSITRIGFVPGLSPDNAVMAANLDLWHAVGTAKQNGGATAPPFRSGPSYLAMARSNALLRAAMSAYGDALYLERPLVLIERLEIMGDAGKLRRTLDVFNPEVLSPRAVEAKPWRIGLALAAAEGAALGVEGLSPAIVAAANPIVVSDPAKLPANLAGIAEARSLLTGTRALLVTAPGAGLSGWLVQGDGQLQARLFDPPAKGANAEQAIRDFKQLKSNLARAGVAFSGVGTPYGVPGAPLGGVVGILEANRKMWCYSSVMMGYVADDISDKNYSDERDPEVWKARAGTECEIKPENFSRELGLNLASGAISNLITDSIGLSIAIGYDHFLQETVNPLAAGIMGAGFSAGFEYGGVNQAITNAMK